MAMKAKPKPKPGKKAARPKAAAAKSIRLKAKTVKAATRNGSKPAVQTSARRVAKPAKVEIRRAAAATMSSSRAVTAERPKSKHFSSAIEAYETAIKLMHAEQFEKAIRRLEDIVAEYPEEPEIQERAKMLLHACEKKIQEKGKTVLRSADDHYNVGIADLNRRELAAAIEHLQHALKLTPKADHVLYALATANALQGSRDQAIHYLKQSISYRAENRFLAARDADFESLQEDADFRQLVIPSEK